MNTRLPIFAEATEVNALQRQMGAAHIPSWRHVIVGCLLAALYSEAARTAPLPPTPLRPPGMAICSPSPVAAV
jgi:hypothetical protein